MNKSHAVSRMAFLLFSISGRELQRRSISLSKTLHKCQPWTRVSALKLSGMRMRFAMSRCPQRANPYLPALRKSYSMMTLPQCSSCLLSRLGLQCGQVMISAIGDLQCSETPAPAASCSSTKTSPSVAEPEKNPVVKSLPAGRRFT